MPTDKKLKDAIRARMAATGDGYMKARLHVLAHWTSAAPAEPPAPEPKTPAANRWGYNADMDVDTALFALHSDPDHDNLLWLRDAGIEYDEERAGEPVTPAVAAWWGQRTARSKGFKWIPGMRVLDGYGESYRVVDLEDGLPIVVTDSSDARRYLPMYAWLDLRDAETRRLASASVADVPDPGPVDPWVCRAAKGWEQPKPLTPMLVDAPRLNRSLRRRRVPRLGGQKASG